MDSCTGRGVRLADLRILSIILFYYSNGVIGVVTTDNVIPIVSTTSWLRKMFYVELLELVMFLLNYKFQWKGIFFCISGISDYSGPESSVKIFVLYIPLFRLTHLIAVCWRKVLVASFNRVVVGVIQHSLRNLVRILSVYEQNFLAKWEANS